MPVSRAPWSVTGNLYGHIASISTLAKDLEDAKELFKEWWDALEATLTSDDIAKARRITAEVEERRRRWVAKQKRGE
jgi:hypothetical protein